MPTALRQKFRLLADGARSFRAALVRSLWPSEDDSWLTEAQLRLYRRGSRNSALLLPVAGFFIALACAPWVSRELRTGWWLALTALCLVLDYLGRGLDRVSSRSLPNIRRRAILYCVMSSACLTAWCSMSIFLWAPGQTENHMLIIVVLACSMAGTVAVSAVHPAIAFNSFLLHGLFIIAPAAVSPDGLDRTLAELAFVFCIILSGQVVALNRSMTKMLTLEYERASLVSDLQRAKSESDRERARAASARRAKSQFLSNMNHELRTPMNAILGFSELIKTKAFGDSADRYSEYADIIHDSGQHLLALINDMLDLAKIEGGRLGLRESDVSLAQTISEALEMIAPRAEQAGITLVRDVMRGLPHIRGDERGMRQIVMNLLSNAVKFTPPAGTITVFARSESDGHIVLGVADNGIGIAREDQAHVFERFGKGRHDVTTNEKGTGLGLAIVKGFAEAHDGDVILESELGVGTCVTVLLPASRVLASELTRREAG